MTRLRAVMPAFRSPQRTADRHFGVQARCGMPQTPIRTMVEKAVRWFKENG